jgi:hypothetical protein
VSELRSLLTFGSTNLVTHSIPFRQLIGRSCILLWDSVYCKVFVSHSTDSEGRSRAWSFDEDSRRFSRHVSPNNCFLRAFYKSLTHP